MINYVEVFLETGRLGTCLAKDTMDDVPDVPGAVLIYILYIMAVNNYYLFHRAVKLL